MNEYNLTIMRNAIEQNGFFSGSLIAVNQYAEGYLGIILVLMFYAITVTILIVKGNETTKALSTSLIVAWIITILLLIIGIIEDYFIIAEIVFTVGLALYQKITQN